MGEGAVSCSVIFGRWEISYRRIRSNMAKKHLAQEIKCYPRLGEIHKNQDRTGTHAVRLQAVLVQWVRYSLAFG
jgi:hypothetical protein